MLYNIILEVISYIWSSYDYEAGIHVCDRAQSFLIHGFYLHNSEKPFSETTVSLCFWLTISQFYRLAKRSFFNL
jgi:hypothetical protein